jgi:hypothetical protein
MDGFRALPVTLQGHGMSDQGDGLFVFEAREGEQSSQFNFAVQSSQLPTLLMAVADILGDAHNKFAEQGLPAPDLPLESWTTIQNGEDAFLVLRVFGSEIRFRVTPTTVRTDVP